MFDLIFYSDSRGNEPAAEFISGLRQKSHTDKNETAVHSLQINSIIRILKPLGYTLAVVKEESTSP